ncbi:uncharacterized protein LOC126738398 [Anthonomus grandis grandis]|uniref:uncharacterized protein LOC126738398 n=1 Tax=Anthonomus grandis grandis TaxID=2921223 RepID=UPI002165EFAC|nr:uncharacterized protein LOC126738398 [Anthonomus grandis grandis]
MHKNVTVSDLNVEIHGKGNSVKKHLVAKVGIVVIEFFLASLLYCYGVILSEYFSDDTYNYRDGLWTSILYVCSWSFTDPVARFCLEYFEDRKNIFHRYVIGVSTAFLFIAVMVPDNVVLYTVLGGILSKIISTQINLFATDKLDIEPKIFEAIRQVARALSLFVMPQSICLLAANPDYDINQVKLIYASILLNIIPAALLVKCEVRKGAGELSRYQTIGRFAHQMNEMKSFNSQDEEGNKGESSSEEEEEEEEEEEPVFEIERKYFPVENHLQETPELVVTQEFHSNLYQGIQNFGATEHSVSDLDVPTMHLSPVNVQSYFLNVGVNILPGIPEENEEDYSDNDINQINLKRLSVISSKLEELNIQDQIRRDSVKEVFSINEVINEIENKPESISKIEYIPNFKEADVRISVLDELKNFQKSRRCFHCSPYKKYIWTRRLRVIKDFFHDNFLRPLYHALKNLYFYPSLSTKVITDSVSTLYITLAPFMALQHSWKQHVLFSTENVTFLLTYVAFAWCFFLVGMPLVLRLNHSKIRMVFGFGLLVSGTGLWILSNKPTNDVITISSLLFGFGYGIISYTEKIVYRTSIGMRPWYLVRGTLEVLSAIFILVIYYVFYLNTTNLNLLLFLAAMSYYFNAFLWVCLPFFKYFISIVKRVVFDERSQQEQGFFH